MKTKQLKNYFSDAPAIAKNHPVIFATMIFNLAYGTANVIIGTVDLSFFIGVTGAYSLIFGITKWYALKKKHAIQTQKTDNTNYQAENACAKNIAVCASIMSFLHFSIAVVCLFFQEDPSNYGRFMIFFVSGAAFVKVVLATVNSIKTRKNHSKIIHYLKLTDAANALISLGLAQRAILYYTGVEYAGLISGIGGIFFSLCALTICFFMLIKPIKELRAGNTVKSEG